MGGCMESGNTMVPSGLIQQLNKIKYVSEMEQMKLSRQMKTQEEILLAQFKKETRFRNAITEKAILQRNIDTLNRKHIYMIVENDAKKLLTYKQMLESSISLKNIEQPLDDMLLLDKYFDNNEIKHFCRMMKDRFPELKQKNDFKCNHHQLTHLQSRTDPTPHMEYEYVMQFCQNNSFPLEKINEIHSYRYGM